MTAFRSICALALAAASLTAQAAPVSPAFDTFGNLAGATFGGTGVPTDPTAITRAGNVTTGLTVFQRYFNQAPSNNGAGVFSAPAGLNDGLGTPSRPIGATWGFGWYVDVGAQAKLSAYQVDLYYDADPGASTDFSKYGRLNITAGLAVAGQPGNFDLNPYLSLAQSLGNLYDYNNSFLTIITAPQLDFSNEPGEYGMLLRVADLEGNPVATSAVLINVVPAPPSLALLGLALAGLTVFRRRAG